MRGREEMRVDLDELCHAKTSKNCFEAKSPPIVGTRSSFSLNKVFKLSNLGGTIFMDVVGP